MIGRLAGDPEEVDDELMWSKTLLIAIVVSLAVAASLFAFFMTRNPRPDAFPSPPEPSIAPDGTKTYTIRSGTEVQFPAGTIAKGDVVVCVGKGRASVPSAGSADEIGAIRIHVSESGDVIASCEAHPLGVM